MIREDKLVGHVHETVGISSRHATRLLDTGSVFTFVKSENGRGYTNPQTVKADWERYQESKVNSEAARRAAFCEKYGGMVITKCNSLQNFHRCDQTR